jgi:CelD/BcsL family acetyltransferase involved in cellulose biosynthesis
MNAAAIAAPVHLPFARSEHKVEVVSDYAALLKLRSQWDELMEQAGIDHPFLSHEWVCTWWECFGAGKRLHVLLVKAGEKVVAIAPLMRSRKRMYGTRVRRLGTSFATPGFSAAATRSGRFTRTSCRGNRSTGRIRRCA